MIWSDLFESIFSDDSSGNPQPGSFAKYGLSAWAAQVPYIGQYLGFYLTGFEDLSDLTNFPVDPIDADSDAGSKRAKRNALEDFGIDGGSREKLKSRSDLLADNTTPKVSVEAWLDAPRSPFMGQEMVLDTGWSPRAPVISERPPAEPIQEVFIRAPHPERSKSSPLPSPPRRSPYRPLPESRPELQAAPRAETAPATQWTQEVVFTAEPLRLVSPPVVPDELTRTEWAYVAPDRRLIQPVTHYDTGNRPLNFVLNKVILPWRNALAFSENIVLATALGIDDALMHSPVQVEYEALQYVLPFEGAALEVGPALEYIATSLATSERLRRIATAPVYWFLGVEGAGGGSGFSRVLARRRNAVPSYTEFASQFGKLERGELAHEQGAMLGDLMFHGQRQEALQQLRNQIGHIPARPGKTPAGVGVNPRPGFQSSHTTPQSVFRNLPEYDPNEMITRFLPTGKGHAHTVFDKAWQNEFALIHQQTGRTTTTAGELSDVVSRAAHNSGAFSPAEAESVSQLIINDLFFQLGLTPDTPLRMPGH
jgi:hypothetical protein